MNKEFEEIKTKVRGDFILKKQPVSYTDCVKLYQSLADNLGGDNENKDLSYPNAVPRFMILSPLRSVCTAESRILTQIHVSRL